jgi:hypothetical protein
VWAGGETPPPSVPRREGVSSRGEGVCVGGRLGRNREVAGGGAQILPFPHGAVRAATARCVGGNSQNSGQAHVSPHSRCAQPSHLTTPACARAPSPSHTTVIFRVPPSGRTPGLRVAMVPILSERSSKRFGISAGSL